MILVFIIILIGLVGCTKEPALKVYSLNTPAVSAVYGNTYKNKSIKILNNFGSIPRSFDFNKTNIVKKLFRLQILSNLHWHGWAQGPNLE